MNYELFGYELQKLLDLCSNHDLTITIRSSKTDINGKDLNISIFGPMSRYVASSAYDSIIKLKDKP